MEPICYTACVRGYDSMSLIDILSHSTFFGYAQQFQDTMTASRALPCSCEEAEVFVTARL